MRLCQPQRAWWWVLLARESKEMVKKSPWKNCFCIKKIYKDNVEALKARGEAGGVFSEGQTPSQRGKEPLGKKNNPAAALDSRAGREELQVPRTGLVLGKPTVGEWGQALCSLRPTSWERNWEKKTALTAPDSSIDAFCSLSCTQALVSVLQRTPSPATAG